MFGIYNNATYTVSFCIQFYKLLRLELHSIIEIVEIEEKYPLLMAMTHPVSVGK